MKRIRDVWNFLTLYSDFVLAAGIIISGIAYVVSINDSVAEATRVNVRQDATLEKQMILLQETHDAVIELKTLLKRRH